LSAIEAIMTDRERWTVYPLLFLALGLSLKDKLTQSVSTKTLVCNELVVYEPNSQKQVRLAGGQVAATGEVAASGDLKAPALVCNSLLVVNKKGKVVATVSSNNDSGAVNVADAEGKVLASISSNNDGGQINVLGQNTGTTTLLGNFQHLAGLIFLDAQGRPHASSATFVSPFRSVKPAEAGKDEAEGGQPADKDAGAESEGAEEKVETEKANAADSDKAEANSPE
jgi:hypothetical protein